MIVVTLKLRCPWCMKHVRHEIQLDPATRMEIDIDEHRACVVCKQQFKRKD